MPDQPAKPTPRRWRAAVLTSVIASVIAAVALVAGADLYLVSTTRAAIVDDVAAAPVRPFALVLGNLVNAAGVPSRELGRRLDTARALYQTGRAKQVIVSGMVRRDYDEPHPMAAWLVARGVPAADIVIDVNGRRTAASMADAAALGVRSMLVVSQGYHLPRAVYLARAAGIDAVGVVAPSGPRSNAMGYRNNLREALARAEAVLEVAVRGVRP